MLQVLPRVYNGEESLKVPYTASKMIVSSPIASVLTPLKGFSEH